MKLAEKTIHDNFAAFISKERGGAIQEWKPAKYMSDVREVRMIFKTAGGRTVWVKNEYPLEVLATINDEPSLRAFILGVIDGVIKSVIGNETR